MAEDTLPAYKQAMLDGSEDGFAEEEEVVAKPEGEEEAAEEEQSSDTETETVETTEEETDTETATDENAEATPLDATMEELGLNKQYGTPDAALRAVPEQRKHIETQNRENQELRRLLQRQLEMAQQRPPVAKPSLTPDEVAEGLASDPQRTLRDAGFVTTNEVQDQIQPLLTRMQQLQQEAENNRIVTVLQGLDGMGDVAAHFRSTGDWPAPGVSPLWDSMMEKYHARPVYSQMPTGDVLAVLHDVVTAHQKSGKPPVAPVSSKKKAGASTTAGTTGAGKGGVPNFNKMSHGDILEWAAAHGMVDE